MDENKNSHQKITMTHTTHTNRTPHRTPHHTPHTQTATTHTNRIALRAGKKRGRVLLRLEPWPQCSKNQLQSSNKHY